MGGRKTAALGFVLGALILGLSTTSATASPIRVQLPAPGQTTLTVAQARYRGKAPRRFALKLANPAKLPSSVRGLYAIYERRRGPQTIVTFLTLVLRQEPPKAARPRTTASASAADNRRFELYFLAGVRPAGTVEDEARKPMGWGPPVSHRASQVYGSGHDTMPSSSLQGLFKEGGVEPDVEKTIGTGHYDDGHAFGWKASGTAAALSDWVHLSTSGAPYEALIEKVEEDINADLDGNGQVGGAGGSGGGTTIETVVGPPTVQ
jgi:hypothetical protein